MKTGRTFLALTALLPLVTVAEEAEPAEVARVRADLAAQCRSVGAEPTFGDSFLARVNVTPDGRPDYLLSTSAVWCGDQSSPNCGTAGCVHIVVASVNGRYVRVFEDHAKGFERRRVRDRDHFLVSGQGDYCGPNETEDCERTLAWNGRRFAAIPPRHNRNPR